MPLPVKHGVYSAFCDYPPPLNVSVVKHACIHSLCTVDLFGGHDRVIPHREMQVQHIISFAVVRFLYPVLVKPVFGAVRIAVKPQPGAVHGQGTGDRLIHKAFRHECHFIEQDSCQRQPLYKLVRAFVLSAEHIESVGFSTSGNCH